MTKTAQEKAKDTRLRNELYKAFADNGWSYRGTEFQKFVWLGRGAVKFGCWFSCNLKYVKARIEGETQYQLEDRAGIFTGETAMEDCMKWTTENLVDMCSIVEKRLIAADKARLEYLRTLRGE